MDKNFKPVYVRGTETGKGVIKTLEQLGGINKNGHRGNNPDNIYFICPKTHEIDYAFKDTTYANYIEATSEEIKPTRWRAKQDNMYYLVDTNMNAIEVRDYGTSLDDDHYNCGNYFRTKEEAQEMAEIIKKVLLPD